MSLRHLIHLDSCLTTGLSEGLCLNPLSPIWPSLSLTIFVQVVSLIPVLSPKIQPPHLFTCLLTLVFAASRYDSYLYVFHKCPFFHLLFSAFKLHHISLLSLMGLPIFPYSSLIFQNFVALKSCRILNLVGHIFLA